MTIVLTHHSIVWASKQTLNMPAFGCVRTPHAPGRHEGSNFLLPRRFNLRRAVNHMPTAFLLRVHHLFKHHMNFCLLGNRDNSADCRRITHGCVTSLDHLPLLRHVAHYAAITILLTVFSSFTLWLHTTWT
jgi:hypothetical protein